MSVKRRVNWISQQRVDVPDVRALESAASNDFDELIKSFVTGTTRGYVLRGFELSMAGAIGGAASGLQMIVDPGAIFHINSSQSGTFYLVPSGTPTQQLNSATNNIVDGAFAPSAINYVGIEYERFIDDTTQSQVYIWSPSTNTETTKTAPRAQILRYRIKITTTAFASNVLPICTVLTDSGNNVQSITDSRYDLYRLGTGGTSPNPFYVYPWNAQAEGRVENPSTSTSNGVNPFRGGDKMIGSLKEWMDAIMTSLLEIKGTTYWYSTSSAGSLESLREDLGNTVTTGPGIISHSDTTAGQINWDEDISIKVIGSALNYKLIANPSSTDITLADDEVAYVQLIRNVSIVPNLVFVNGSAVVTSVGAVTWTSNLQAGDFVKLSADTNAKYYEIDSVDSVSQVTLVSAFSGTSTGAGGAKAKYAYGSYQTSPTPSTDRHIKIINRFDQTQDLPGQDFFWFLLRSDNGGVIPRVYVRFLGSELEQGESEEIDDGVPRQLLQYIGSPLESASRPQYVSALNAGSVAEVTDFTFGSAATISSNQYFFVYSSGTARSYYVWFNKNGTGVDPAPLAAFTGIEVAISTGQTSSQIANAVAAAMLTTYYPDFTTSVSVATVRVTNKSAGTASNATNFNMGAPFAISIIVQGTGTGNFVVNDGDNLTLAIKKLDLAIGNLLASLDDPSYDEQVTIVTSGEVPPDSLNGPISASTIIDLPDNSRMGSITQYYTVGNGSLQVYLNGQYLVLDEDWSEVGSAGVASNSIEILQGLVVGDVLTFRISTGGAGSGGGGMGPPGPPGPTGPPGLDAVDPVTVSTKTGNYTVLITDKVLLGDCTSGDVTFTLPPAASANGRIFYLKKIDSSVNSLFIQADGIEEIDGANNFQISMQYGALTVACDGTAYWII